MDKTEETYIAVTDESEEKETEMELVDENVDVLEGTCEDECADCILEDVLLIDSEDGIDEDTTPTVEIDSGDAKPSGINILLIMLCIIFISLCFNAEFMPVLFLQCSYVFM